MSSTPSTSAQQQDIEQLRKLFIPTRTKAVGQINEQLALFRRKRHLDTNFVEEYSQLETLSRSDHSAELRLSEKILFRTLAHLMQLANPIGPPEFGNCERKTLALIISVATLIKVVMGLRTNHSNWEKLLDKCPTFLSQIPKTGAASSMFKMLGSGGGTSVKQKLQLRDHQIDHCWPQQQQKGTKQQPPGSSGRSKLVAGSTTSLTSPARIPQHYHRDSNVSSGIHHHYYPHSLLSAESVFSSPSLALTKQRQLEKQHLNLLPSQKSSISLTPPINRSQHSISGSVVAMAGSSKESSSIDRHGNDLIPPELIDADAATNGGGGENGPRAPAAVVRLQHQQQHHMESLDSGSSPPSSSAMLPPPVFSSRFERILPPDIPPSSAPPPPPVQKTAGNGQIEAPLKIASTLQPSMAATTGGGHGQLRSMDSGIGTEVTTASGPSSSHIHGGIGRTASDLPRATVQQQQVQQQQHSSVGPARSQSMKVN
uniref:RGS-like domain-containing protein n=1 Tax=Meloidogyne hapla TaxID=6305 RepID=A0A1I8BTV3_MELHA